MLTSYFLILKKRDFSLLWFGQIISQFGERLTQMALIGLVYKVEPGSSIVLAKMLSLAIVPVFLISPVAGVYVDRWDKRKTMYVSDFLRSIIIFLVPILFLIFKSLWLVYIPLFFSFCIGRFFIPAKMAIIPNLVKKEEFFLANSLVSVTAMIAAILGFGIGGVIVEKLGAELAFIFNVATFLISSLFIFCMSRKANGKFKFDDIVNISKDAILNIRKSFLFEVKEGFKYILSSKETRYAAKIFSILFAAVGALYTVFIVFIQETFSSATKELGWLAVGLGIGLFFGSILYGKIAKKFDTKKTINFCLLIASIYLVLFVVVLRLYPNKLFSFIASLIWGVSVSPIIVAINTLIHKESDNEFWGRIFSSLEVVIHLAFIVFMFISSYFAEIFTPFTMILSVGIIISVLALYNLICERQ